MTQRERYNLVFERKFTGTRADFICHQLEGSQFAYGALANKLTLMHRLECEGLIDEIQAAENNEYYEEYFAIDNDAASDFDEIYIKPPYVTIDKHIFIPFQDMKELLMEWISFMVNKNS